MHRIYPSPGEIGDLAREYAFPVSQRAWLRSVFVSSLDGAATFDGRSGALGNDADKSLFALLRGLADVVLVGAETARREEYGPVEPDPIWADVRVGRPPTPPLAVISRQLALDAASPLFSKAPNRAPTIIITCKAAPQEQLEALRDTADLMIAGNEYVDMAEAVNMLMERGYMRISCEGGPRVLAQVAVAGLLDELCLTLSPKLVAGKAPRIANGLPIPGGLAMQLVSVLEDRGHLFLRYVRATPSA